jgi:hypothetical protein
VNVQLIVADHAAVAEGKLFINGGGWNSVNLMQIPSPIGFSVALIISVPWAQAEQNHTLAVELQGPRGELMALGADQVGDPVTEIRGNFSVGRPPHVVPGEDIVIPVALAVATNIMEAGPYRLVVLVDDIPEADWSIRVQQTPPTYQVVVPPQQQN